MGKQGRECAQEGNKQWRQSQQRRPLPRSSPKYWTFMKWPKSSLEKSAVSEHFVEASRSKLKELTERRLDKRRLCALLIDATPFEGQQMIVALGIGQDGRKTILGIRQGASENATVVGELLGDLMNRGLDFSTPRLYVLDGGKALHAAVKKYAGESAPIQRCQVHIAGRDPRLPEGWKVPSRASPYKPGSLGSGMTR